jgi:hypothetical protein
MNRTETILGERCRWIDKMPDVADDSLRECVTPDGMRLSVSGGDLIFYSYKARRIRRGGVSAADMQPPRQAFAWLR